MDENILWWRKKILAAAARSLEANGFSASVEENKHAAAEKIISLIPPSATVGAGGSMSIRELSVLDRLAARGQKLICHTQQMSREEAALKRREAFSSDVYLASPQGVTLDGKLVFLDHNANRSAAVSFGPGKVVLAAGFNKVVFDEPSAVFRARNVAAPINAKRLGLKTPCAETGLCSDCDSPQRICRILETMLKKPASTEIFVVLCAEDIGY